MVFAFLNGIPAKSYHSREPNPNSGLLKQLVEMEITIQRCSLAGTQRWISCHHRFSCRPMDEGSFALDAHVEEGAACRKFIEKEARHPAQLRYNIGPLAPGQ